MIRPTVVHTSTSANTKQSSGLSSDVTLLTAETSDLTAYEL